MKISPCALTSYKTELKHHINECSETNTALGALKSFLVEIPPLWGQMAPKEVRATL